MADRILSRIIGNTRNFLDARASSAPGLSALAAALLCTALAFFASACAEHPGDANADGYASSGDAISAQSRDAAPAPRGDGSPVLIELFTSQGCSSCPPADRVLSLLRQTGQVDGVPIIVLSEHVDYWNRLGWKDPYSSGIFSERQTRYARSISRSNRIYTPQMVVDGQEEFVGHNLRRATAAVRRAATRARNQLKIRLSNSNAAKSSAASSGETRVTASVNIQSLKADARGLPDLAQLDLVYAISEDGLSDDVSRGENHGRTLNHDGVVRALRRQPAQAGKQTINLPFAKGWAKQNAHVVAWLENRERRSVHGAVTASLK